MRTMSIFAGYYRKFDQLLFPEFLYPPVSKKMAGMSCPPHSGEQDPSELTVDRISSLPWNVLDIILGKLPILDAIRTSVLAKDWRYKWLSLSVFDLNSYIVSNRVMTREVKWDEVLSIVGKFLLHRSSSIKSFSLKSELSSHLPDMYQWIEHLSKQPVEVLSLEDYCIKHQFEMPSHLFSFEKLKVLSLRSCALQIPPALEKFRFLYEIFLMEVSINDDDIEHLILACPILGKLTLLNIFGLQHLKIHAPNLVELMIDTKIEELTMGAAQYLSVIHIAYYVCGPEGQPNLNWQNVNRWLSGLPSLQTLNYPGDLIKLWAFHSEPENLPVRNSTLTMLAIEAIRFESIGVFRVCLSLLSSCPMIEHFSFLVESAKGRKLITRTLKSYQGQFSFPDLKVLKMICPKNVGMGSSVSFLEFLSAHSPNLKCVTIHKEGEMEMNPVWVSKMLIRMKRFCPHAVVQYKQAGTVISL